MLLDGPAYHTGMQYAKDTDDKHMRPWLVATEHWPYAKPEQRKEALEIIESRLDGYVATADPPVSLLIPELMELYPDAIVICTVRDVNRWADSIIAVQKHLNWALLRFAYFWLPNMHDFARLQSKHTTFMHDTLFGVDMKTRQGCLATWERHQAWLREIVPKDKLFLVDMKDGWEPLCTALGLPVPVEVEFPRLNDGEALDKLFGDLFIKGMGRWIPVLGALTLPLVLIIVGRKYIL